jgi:hypothetical protein
MGDHYSYSDKNSSRSVQFTEERVCASFII